MITRNDLQRERLLVRDVALESNGAYTGHNILYHLEIGCQAVVRLLWVRLLSDHNALTRLTVGQCLPYFLCDEGHKRMKGQHESLKQRNRGTICFCIDRLTVSRLNSLEIPRRELITKEFVSRHQRFGDTVSREIILKFHDRRTELRLHPIDRNSCRIWLFCRIGNLPALH